MTANRNIAGVHAYEHAREARPAPRHRVDVVDEPTLDYGAPPKPRPHPNPYPPAPPAVDRYVEYGQQRRSDYLTHKVDAPTSTAFKFGFGFAAERLCSGSSSPLAV
jgi:hypothetical protein